MHLFRKVFTGFAACGLLAAAICAHAQAAAPAATAPAPAGQSPSAPLTPVSPMDVLGIWQGTLHAGRDLRLELKITQAAAGEYKATFYSVDQGGQPISVSKTTFQDGTLTFTMDAIGGKYQGKMSADGKTITGTWTQGPNPLPLNLDRANADTAWPIPEPPKPMAADANPSFEVATIKPNNSGATQMQGLVIQGRKFLTRASSLQDLLSFAYNVQVKQIVNGPAWIGSDRYDIEALPDAEGVPNTQQIRVMIQKLLADRFKLTFHHEQREMAAYVLEVGKTGPKLTLNQSKGNLQHQTASASVSSMAPCLTSRAFCRFWFWTGPWSTAPDSPANTISSARSHPMIRSSTGTRRTSRLPLAPTARLRQRLPPRPVYTRQCRSSWG